MADFRGEAEIIWEEPIASCAPRKKKKSAQKIKSLVGRGQYVKGTQKPN